MLDDIDRKGIAERIRGLIAGQDHGELAKTARRLGVTEVALRMSIDEAAPEPTLNVIIATIRHYGVDPVWLVTGVYNGETHFQTFAGQDVDIGSIVTDAISARDTSREPPRLRLEM